MDIKKKDMYLSMDKESSAGWAVKSVPAPVHRPGAPAESVKGKVEARPVPKPMPAPMPAPMPVPVPVPPAEECGYCITPGMSYTPMQDFDDVYEAEEGFVRGTIFAALDYPFMGKGDCRRD